MFYWGYYMIILCLVLFQIKHFLVDYLWQTQDQLDNKGSYGNLIGISHSVFHGIGTQLCLAPFLLPSSFPIWVGLTLFDIIAHYHIDWTKMHYGSHDKESQSFWIHIGLDQLAHQLTYLVIILVTFW